MTGETIPSSVIWAAQAAQAKWLVPSSCSIAQWCLESDYGKKIPPGSNNPFGIKASAGEKSVVVATHEVIDGKSVEIQAGFKIFDTVDAAFDYHGKLIATAPVYKPVMAKRMNANDFANALTGRYATDPNYGAKLISIMTAHNLYVFNDLTKGKVMAPVTPTGPASHTPGTNAAIWANGLGALLSALGGFVQYLPPQYAIAGTIILGLNGMLHQVTGQSQ
jgi:hypothetical protein